jgi:hypothetical protein
MTISLENVEWVVTEMKTLLKSLFYTTYMKFEVLTSVSDNIGVFWNVTPCDLVDRYQHFGLI